MTKKHPLLKHLREEILPTVFCQGCGGGTVLNVYAHAIEELKIKCDPKKRQEFKLDIVVSTFVR